MSTTLRHELRLQTRSLRFKFGVPVVLLVPMIAPLYILLTLEPATSRIYGPGAYWQYLFEMLRFPTLALSLIVAGNGSDINAMERMWPVLSSSPAGNLSYMIRRSLAQIVIVLPLTLVPVLFTFGVLHYGGQEIVDVAAPLGMWAAKIVPVAVFLIFFWTALIHITGTEMGGLLFFFLGDSISRLLFTHVLGPLTGTRLFLHQDWIGSGAFISYVQIMLRTFDSRRALDYWGDRLWSSDVLPPFKLLLLEQAPAFTLFASMTALLYGIAGFFLRRTRSDLRPLVLSETHPLRNFIKYFHLVRQRYAPDGGLRLEPRALIVGLLILFGGIMVLDQRQHAVSELADRQYASETATDHVPVTPRTVAEDWTVDGTIDGTALDVTVLGRIHHGDTQALSRLPFDFNPFLELEVEVPGRSATVHRSWARLFVDVEPELQPGDTIEIRFKVKGTPTVVDYHYQYTFQVDSFATRYEAMRDGVPLAEGNDLARSAFNPLILPRRVYLNGSDWIPTLRYGTWQLTPRPVLPGEQGYEVPLPTAFPRVSFTLDLSLPDDWLVGDSCGGTGRDGRLQSTCRVAASNLALRGGRRTVVEKGPLLLAALPGHDQRLGMHEETLRQLVDLSGQAWPGLEPLQKLVVIEGAPFDTVSTVAGDLWLRWFPSFETLGRTVVLGERWVADEEPLSIERLVSAILAEELLNRRALEPAESQVFQGTFGALMTRRMGLARGGGATVPDHQYGTALMESRNPSVRLRKASALWAYVEALVGTGAMHAGIEAFLSKNTETRGSYREMLQDIETESGVSLVELYEDYVVGSKLPQLRLEDVRRSKMDDGRWLVEGTVVNRGSGRLQCPLKVESQQQRVEVELDLKLDGASTPFELLMDYRPDTVQLDPELTCFRWVTLGRLKAEKVSLLGE